MTQPHRIFKRETTDDWKIRRRVLHTEVSILPGRKPAQAEKDLNTPRLEIWSVSKDSPNLLTKPETTLTKLPFLFQCFQSKQRDVVFTVPRWP